MTDKLKGRDEHGKWVKKCYSGWLVDNEDCAKTFSSRDALALCLAFAVGGLANLLDASRWHAEG